ncbi:MAG: ABC transporter ATP-binding protein [Ruminococcaceae bacterium]|nr:ABC transporter ATP-binding protein [Oscillospiraceae bacterium]
MSEIKTFSNKPVPEKIQEIADKNLENMKILFAVVGDLNLDGKYDESAFFVTETSVLAVDSKHENGCRLYSFDEIEKVIVKRMYGNAIIRIRLKETDESGKNKIEIALRFTYVIADIADAAAVFINNVIKGLEVEEQLLIVKSTYDKQRSFCPKCGRKLASPDADCYNCKGKGKIISKLMKYLMPEKGKLIFCIVLSVIVTALSLVPPKVTQTMVDEILPNNDAKGLIVIILALLGVYVVQYFLGFIRSYFLRIAGDKIIIDLKKDIYAKAQYLPLSYYDKTSTGSVINRVNSDSVVLQNFIMRISQEGITQGFLLVGIAVIMLIMNWKLTLLSLLPVPLVVIGGRIFGKKIGPMYRRLWIRSSHISTLLADTIPGVRVIKSFTNEDTIIGKFKAYCDDWLKEDKRASMVSSIFPNVMTFLITCGSVIIWYVGGRWIIDPGNNSITIGMLVSFISYTSMFYGPVGFFANISDSYQSALASAEKIFDIIDAEPEHDFAKGDELPRMDGKIEFRNVNFAFDRSKKVVDNVSFTLNPGDIVGIVGTTGSGKSTLINLLMRFYDDYEGEILVDDVNIKDIDMKYYRDQIGYVQQEPLMFKDTVFNNIAYGTPNAHVEQVIYAADVANAHGFISRLPDSYDTYLGERGIGLSGGEKQRLSIARAVMKNPSILIFDEATAAVDSETEELIQQAIERLIRGRTTLMIAHRLSTLRKANRILVVDKGRIIENGSHEELMALKGKYYKLIQIQSMSQKVREQKESENFE